MEQFKDTFCCSLFKESKHNTSLKPNLLADLFQHSFKIECKFVAEDNGKAQWIFSKQGIVNSGVYINGDKLYCTLSTSSNDIDFSNNEAFMIHEFEYDKEYKLIYEVNVENNEFITTLNSDVKKLKNNNKVSDYSNVPLWIGTSNPFVQNKNYFNGTISEIIIYSNALSVSDRQKVESYLRWKWNTFTLDPSNPYSAQAYSNYLYPNIDSNLIPPVPRDLFSGEPTLDSNNYPLIKNFIQLPNRLKNSMF